MTNERLEYFMAVVEEGSISAAARRLHLSQPPVSLQIQNLENDYGVKLFTRSKQGSQLTEAGKILYAYAVRIRDIEGEAEEDIKELQSGHRGKIRLGVISSGNCRTFLNALAAYRRKYPEVRFTLMEGNTYQLLDDLLRQQIDLAVIRTPFSRKGIEVKELEKDQFIACGTEEKMSSLRKNSIQLQDLAGFPLIIYRRWERILRDAFEKANIDPDIICLNDDARTCIQWAEMSLGIALVPSSILPSAHHLISVPVQENQLISTICIVRKNNTSMSESSSAFWKTFTDKRKV